MNARACRLKVFPDSEALSRQAAASVAAQIRKAAADGRSFSLVMAGGNTPESLYNALASEFREAIPWERVVLFWGDERYVPPDDPRSNFGMAERILLRRVRIPAGNIHAMPTEFPDPDEAARVYEATLRDRFPAPLPRFDLVLLGMGEDGHTASLFPGSPVLNERECWVAAVRAPAQPPVRLTLTLPVLNNASCIYFLVAGANKAPTMLSALTSQSPHASPASLIRPRDGEVVWWCDEAAANLIPSNAFMNNPG
ncbi:MAG: 6-phosphogluconolactonase [Acidobacteria bacterium]|nr:6-phosphogluconolactonase [Acidobacteriota bacterium]